jgi:tetratricopeptide (TPR) repeat protein
VALRGASGSGKSSLLDRLGVPVRARAYLPEQGEPWSLLRTLLREVLALDVTTVDTLPLPLAAAVGRLLPEVASSGVAPEPESLRGLLQEATLRLLARAGPVAVDDLQWGDPSSLEVLEAAAARGVPLVLAVRPDEADDRVDGLLTRVATERVDLGPLPDAAIRELVDDPVGFVLCRDTDRSPMAVVETLRALAAEGLTVPTPGGAWRCTSPDAGERAAVIAGEGQRRAIAARVAARPSEERDVLAVLALLARETSPALLAAATGTGALDALSELHRRGLVRFGEEGWATAHDMVTEVVVASLDLAERTRFHAGIAAALADSDDPALLAHHLRAAGDAEGARAAYLRAAQRALTAVADHEAVRHAEAGLALGSWAALLEVRGQARQRLGDLNGARADLRAALTGTTDGPARSGLLARLAMLALGADDPVRGGQLAELALAEAGQAESVRARALEVASVLDMNLDHAERAAERSAEALRLYERAGDGGGMARVLDAQAMAQFLDGDVRGGGASLRRAAELFEDAGDLVRVVTPRSTGGHAAVFEGRPEEGLAQATAALELARMLGHPEGQTYSLWHRTEALAALGRCDEASESADEALEIATRIEHRGWTATAWRSQGLAAESRGDLEAALAAYQRQLELSEHLGLFACWAGARAALVLVRLGRAEAARPLVARALLEGPPLGHHEARWAQVEVAAALDDLLAPELAVAALGRMETAGVVQGHAEVLRIASTA